MFQVVASESTKTGRAPQYATAFAEATYVRVGTMTSSPLVMPSARSARCRATVPFEQDMPCSTVQNFANSRSKLSIYFPAEEIQVDSRQSLTYFFSLPT